MTCVTVAVHLHVLLLTQLQQLQGRLQCGEGCSSERSGVDMTLPSAFCLTALHRPSGRLTPAALRNVRGES